MYKKSRNNKKKVHNLKLYVSIMVIERVSLMGIKLKNHINDQNMKLSRSEVREFLTKFFGPSIRNEYTEIEVEAVKNSVNLHMAFEFNKGSDNFSVENKIQNDQFENKYIHSDLEKKNNDLDYLCAA